jgi:hypothetical protein
MLRAESCEPGALPWETNPTSPPPLWRCRPAGAPTVARLPSAPVALRRADAGAEGTEDVCSMIGTAALDDVSATNAALNVEGTSLRIATLILQLEKKNHERYITHKSTGSVQRSQQSHSMIRGGIRHGPVYSLSTAPDDPLELLSTAGGAPMPASRNTTHGNVVTCSSFGTLRSTFDWVSNNEIALSSAS